MAVKPKDVRGMNAPDRTKLLVDTRAELMHQRGLAAMGGAVKNPGKIRDLRTTIARILTVQHQLLEDTTAAPGGRRPAAKPAARPAGAKAPAKAPARAARPKPAPAAAPKPSKPKAAGAPEGGAARKKTGGTR